MDEEEKRLDEEEKGFVIKDRRSFDDRGELKEEKSEDEAKKEEAKKGEVKREEVKKEEAGRDDSQRMPLPEVNFNSLIISLSSSALLNFGEIADPQTGEKKKDLAMAKQSIDIISMLKEKTKGNLTDEEQKFVDNILTDLRWGYVNATK
jgi:hypothetical protein